VTPEPGHREQVIETLKAAFVQDRLTKDEFDARVAGALASRTHADLAALTADLPAESPAIRPPRSSVPARPKNPTVRTGVRLIAATTVVTGGVWADALLNQSGQMLGALASTFTVIWLGVVILVAAIMIESRRRIAQGGL
jgi:hypothetical protein